jgi:hypothetical protein
MGGGENVLLFHGSKGTTEVEAYAYRALFEPGDRRGTIVVTFPDVPEAITGDVVSPTRAPWQKKRLGLRC